MIRAVSPERTAVFKSLKHSIERRRQSNDSASRLSVAPAAPCEARKALFYKEKERRDRIFRDRNAQNYNITGEMCYEKAYPIKKVRKVYYNDILSYDEFLANQIDGQINDEKMEMIAPISRQLKDVTKT